MNNSAKRYALFGSPIKHSPTPAIHNAGFSHLGLDVNYQLRATPLPSLPAALDEIKQGKWAGANITTPLKTEFAKHFKLNDAAARAGAMNTLYQDKGGKWRGALTDITGITTPLRNHGYAGGGTALIIGAGGASRAAVLALESLDTTIHIAARDITKGQALLDELKPLKRGAVVLLNDVIAKHGWLSLLGSQIDVVIQATPVGRDGVSSPLDVTFFERHGVQYAFDMLYLPVFTPFLEMARFSGADLIFGYEMMLAQAARSFILWTGKAPPLDVMASALHNHLDR